MNIGKTSLRRVGLVSFLLCGWVFYIAVTLVKVQILNYEKFKEKIKSQRNRIVTFHPKRGTIYDARGRILAISLETRSAFIHNAHLEPRRALEIVRQAKNRLGLSNSRCARIHKYIRRGDSFIWLLRKLSDHEYQELSELQAEVNRDLGPGAEGCRIDFVEKDEYRRVYPRGSLLAHVLGGVGIDEQGLAGFEYAQDEKIKGKGGKKLIMVDAKNRPFENRFLEAPVFGQDYYLTVDLTIQYFVEKELRRGMLENQARAATAIVMESRTGDILAMANLPTYDPARISETPLSVVRNNAIQFVYEPGSTFKVILGALALKNKITSPAEKVYCHNGSLVIQGETIHDHHSFGTMTFEEVIINSSNIGAAKVGMRFDREQFFQGIREFGLGERPFIQLPGKEMGLLKEPRYWSSVSPGFISHGYEIAVTPLQLLKAVNVIAAGGIRIAPNIIQRPRDEQVRSRSRVISARVCERMTDILKKVVKEGTGQQAGIRGLAIAGKTGTAKKNVDGKYVDQYIASFVGFFPAEDPQVTMIVLFDQPRGNFYGGDVAAPVFKRICERLIIYRNILPAQNRREVIL